MPSGVNNAATQSDLLSRSAAALLPSMRAHTGTLRWRGGIRPQSFVDTLCPTVTKLLTGADDDDPHLSPPNPFAGGGGGARGVGSEGMRSDEASAVLRELCGALAVPITAAHTGPRRKSTTGGGIDWGSPIAVFGAARNMLGVFYDAALTQSHTPGETPDLSATLSWEDWLSYLLDCGVQSSAALFTIDPFYFVPHARAPFSVACSYFRMIGADTAAIVQQHNAHSSPEGILARVSTHEALERAPWPHSVSHVEHIPQRRLFCCCSDLTVFFMDAKTAATVIAELVLDQLTDAPSCAYWSSAVGRLFIGTRSGKLLEASPPEYRIKSGVWAPPVVHHVVQLPNVSVPVVGVTETAAPQTVFVLTSHGTIATYGTLSHTVLGTMSCSDHGLHLCTSFVYNPAADLLVCAGESPSLLCWVGRNATEQTPITLEDRGAPHQSRVLHVATEAFNGTATGNDKGAFVVASIDGTGVLKIWDLNRLECTQTIRLLMPPNHLVHLDCTPARVIVATKSEYQVFRIDESKAHAAVSGLTGHPRGLSVCGAVGTDVIEWSCANGRKMSQHVRLADSQVRCVAFDEDGSTLFVLTERGSLTIHSASTGKRIGSYAVNEVLQGHDALSLHYCASSKRIIVPSVGDVVACLPVTFDKDGKFRRGKATVTLSEGDTTCTALAVGKLDSGTTAYYVGTSEGTLQILVCRSETRVEVSNRLRMPAASAAGSGSPSLTVVEALSPQRGAHDAADASVERERSMLESLMQPEVTHVHWCTSHIICADSTGAIFLFLNRGHRLTSTARFLMQAAPSPNPLHVLVPGLMGASANDALESDDALAVASSSVDEPTSAAELEALAAEAFDGAGPRSVTCMASLVAGSFLVVGDSHGCVTVVQLERKRSLAVLESWRAHLTPITKIAVENDCVITTGTDATLLCWSLKGDRVGSWWGPTQSVRPVDAASPKWLEEFDARESASTVQLALQDTATIPPVAASGVGDSAPDARSPGAERGAADAAAAGPATNLLAVGAMVNIAKKKLLRKAQQHSDRRLAETVELSKEDSVAIGGVLGGPKSAAEFGSRPKPGSIAVSLLGEIVMQDADKLASALDAGFEIEEPAPSPARTATNPERSVRQHSGAAPAAAGSPKHLAQFSSPSTSMMMMQSGSPPGALTVDTNGAHSSSAHHSRAATPGSVASRAAAPPSRASTVSRGTAEPCGRSVSAPPGTDGLIPQQQELCDWRKSKAVASHEMGPYRRRLPRALNVSNATHGLPVLRSHQTPAEQSQQQQLKQARTTPAFGANAETPTPTALGGGAERTLPSWIGGAASEMSASRASVSSPLRGGGGDANNEQQQQQWLPRLRIKLGAVQRGPRKRDPGM